MKRVSLLLTLGAVLAACGGGGGLNASGGSAKIEGWPGGTGTYQFTAGSQNLASGTVNSDGTFSYTLATPSTLTPVGTPPSGCTLSPTDVQSASASPSIRNAGGTSLSISISSIAPTATRAVVGDGIAQGLIYLNKDMRLSGTCFGSVSGDVTLRTGWNWVWLEFTAVDNTGVPTAATFKGGSNLPGSFKWYYNPSSPAVLRQFVQPGPPLFLR